MKQDIKSMTLAELQDAFAVPILMLPAEYAD